MLCPFVLFVAICALFLSVMTAMPLKADCGNGLCDFGVMIIPVSGTVCVNSQITFRAVATACDCIGPYTFLWSGDTFGAGPLTNFNLTVTPTNCGNFNISVYVEGHCDINPNQILTGNANASYSTLETTAPTILCPTGRVFCVGQTLTPPTTVSDNCGVASVTPTNVVVSGTGTNTQTWTATDLCSNTASCMESYLGVGVGSVSNSTVILCAGDSTNFVAIPDPVGATFPHDPTWTISPTNAGILTPSGTTATFTSTTPCQVTVTITAACGSSSNSATVTVRDCTPPTITCPSNITSGSDPGHCSKSNVTFAATASDNCPGVTTNCSPASGSTFNVGTNLVTCTAVDAGNNTNTCSFTVTISDTEPPTVTCPTNLTLNTDVGLCARSNVTYSASATDNCSVATTNCVPPSGSTFNKGTNSVTCTATDGAGNSSNCTFHVIIRDMETPTITCPSNVQVCATGTLTTVTFPDPTGSDNCPGVTSVCVPSSGSTFAVGSNTVTCSATDAAGNSNTCSFAVVVYDLALTPSAFSVCVGETTNFVAGTSVAGATFSWTPGGIVSTAADGKSSTNAVSFNTATNSQVMQVSYGPCSTAVTGTVVAVTNIFPMSTNLCAGDSATFTASAHPLGASFPPGQPTWTLSPTNAGTLMPTNGVTTTFTASTNFNDVAVITAHCGTSMNSATAAVVKIEKVEWEGIDPGDGQTNLSADNPGTHGGGWRIFPDKNEGGAGGKLHDKVKVKAKVFPAVQGVGVFFVTYDVDDPTDDNGPIDDDSGTPGSDNRGGAATQSSSSSVTGTNGVAEIELTVKMKPGDNYRVVAACDSAQFTGLKAKQPDSLARVEDAAGNVVLDDTGTVANRKSTPLLSVWRRIHLELDSMAAGSDVSHTGNIDKLKNNSYHAPDGACELNGFNLGDEGRFEGGKLTVPATTNMYVVVDNVDVTIDDHVVTVGPVAQGDKNKSATVTDDDGTNLPRKVVISLINDKYKPAYIEGKEIQTASDLNATFQATIDDSDVTVTAVGNQRKTLQTEPAFWVALVVSCHQGKDDAEPSGIIKSLVDADPDISYHIHTSPLFTKNGDDIFMYAATVPFPGSNITALFLETIRDYGAQSAAGLILPPAAQTAANLESITVVHEVGHQFGLDPTDSSGHKPNTIMEESITDTSKVFDEEQIRLLRSNHAAIEN
jgi:hypothetical protein